MSTAPAHRSRMTGDDGNDGAFRLLTLCTANQCRSPMAEVLAAHELERRGIDAEVTSRGFLSEDTPASPDAVRAVSRLGLDLSHHRSRVLDPDDALGADLIVAMERRHLVSLAEVSVGAVDCAFTLPELADLAVVIGPRGPDQTIASWVAAASAMRWPTTVLSTSTDDDVRDPMGGPSRAFRRTALHIRKLLGIVFDALFPADASTP